MERPELKNPFTEKDVYVFTDLEDYLKETGRENLCKDIYTCDKWEIEPILLNDLDETDDINRVRGMIRAISNFPPDRRSDAEVLHAIDRERRLKDPMWARIESTLRSTAVGEEVEDAVKAVEEEYGRLMNQWRITEDETAKQHLRDEMGTLRPIRDRLYLRRVHPDFATKMIAPRTIVRFTPSRPAA